MEHVMFQGKEMWIGAADILTGKIRETHTMEEAKKADFHTCFYFSDEQEQKHDKKECIFFWIQDGKVELEYNDLSPLDQELLKKKIREQVMFMNQEKYTLLKKADSVRRTDEPKRNQKQIQILYSCNEWKERSSMEIVGVTSKPEVLILSRECPKVCVNL